MKCLMTMGVMIVAVVAIATTTPERAAVARKKG